MFLIDTNVISEWRKGRKANPGVVDFFTALKNDDQLFISVITIGELKRGAELIRHRGDTAQATQLEQWLETIMRDYENNILPFGNTEAMIWGHLRAPNPHNSLDKQIAATALAYDLRVVTRNTKDFANLGLEIVNPFTA